VEQLPLWFLLLSLALPRISLLIGYFITDISIITNLNGWIPPALGVLVPRALVLILIFQDLGMSPWLLVHAIAMAAVYAAAGSQ
jgi:hypothetical protein